ncbi:DEAD/DEAH box helicase [Parahaliea mediterranea]|uniref:DEAD/DEAH box helicase n=1 Tax=Parahaliea mediterranea TaxID=651086 RepID=UPI0014731E8C|nr:DEAD/DEAH box helicase [Parahaliea mediterranea]
MLQELPLDRQLRLALDELALATPTPVQAQVIPAALTGSDLLVSAATGSGKTLAYLLPTLQRLLEETAPRQAGTLALVLVPTRELARQVLKSCRQLTAKSPLQCMALTGGADFKYQKAQFRKNPEVVIATPGRLLEHCEKGSADLAALKVLVLDEADRMLEMGFREDVLKITDACNPARQTLMLSATLKAKGLGELSNTLLNAPQTIAVDPPRQAQANIHHQRILADSTEHKNQLLLALLAQNEGRRSLVFANKRRSAERLAGLLAHNGLKADCLHGEMSTEERKRVMAAFREGKIQVLCASDLAARGLDVPDIDTVINYDLPHSGDDYVHRCGRTGRAGASGVAISLVEASQWNLMISIQRYLNMDFEQRALPGLKAKYSGPKKAKGSGKAAGSKKKKPAKGEAKAKQRARDAKNKGKPKRPKSTAGGNDGTGPLMKKK